MEIKKRERKIDQNGFSLIEALVSMALLAIVSAALNAGFMMQNATIAKAEIKSEAIIAAQQVLDLMRLEDPSLMPSTLTSDPAQTININNSFYSTVVTYCKVATYCPPNTTNDARHITVTVQFKGEEVYEEQTVFTKF